MAVADVRVVRPDDDPRLLPPLGAEVVGEGVQCIGHVGVAEIPRRDAIAEHGAVVLFGRLDGPRALLCVEELVPSEQPGPGRQLLRMLLELDELLDNLLFA